MPVSAEQRLRQQSAVGRDQESQPEQARSTDPMLGPLLAVCGLVGGAGATTLAYLVAVAAGRRSGGPVLVADTGGPSGGLAALSGTEAPRSLPVLASELAAGRRHHDGIYALVARGVRVLAGGPEFDAAPCAAEQLGRLLLDAREAHSLTVVDCGTLASEAAVVAAAAATHRAWVTPATAHGALRGAPVLEAARNLSGRELLVARRDPHESKPPLRELRQMAAERRAPLVLLPHLALGGESHDRALEQAQVPLQAILGALGR
jgi:MinD-like ATPase involved in chromosome partitioning or flagellar assembly